MYNRIFSQIVPKKKFSKENRYFYMIFAVQQLKKYYLDIYYFDSEKKFYFPSLLW